MVIASHSNEMIRRICNKAVHLEKGQVVRAGPVEDVLREYEAEAAAQ
jgi:ABC-2 type transport system ATP-binding protein/lipopolysaccharide transport system ATP-binding protein